MIYLSALQLRDMWLVGDDVVVGVWFVKLRVHEVWFDRRHWRRRELSGRGMKWFLSFWL